jgi:lipoprotein-releasing system permease protein
VVNSVILSEALLEKLGAKVGDTLLAQGLSGQQEPLKVVGSFSSGNRNADLMTVYAPIQLSQRLAGQPGQVGRIMVRLFDLDQADSVAHELSKFSVGLAKDKVESWSQANANFFQVTRVQDLTRAFITWGVVLVAAFGIYNVLSIIVTQKRKEVAILRALGFESRQILSLFLIQGLALGLVGAALGVLVGHGIFSAVTAYFQTLNFGRFSFSLGLSIYIQGFVMSVCSALLASYIPAKNAAKLTPIEIIREEG